MSRFSIYSLLFTFLFATQSFALKVGDMAPAVNGLKHKVSSGETLETELLSLDQKGQYLLLEFFSITCSACSENLPLVAEIQSEFKDKVTFKLVAIDRDEQAILTYLQETPMAQVFTTVLDFKRLTKAPYELKYTPTTFVVSPEGKIVFKHIGVFEPESMEELRQLFQK